MPSKQIPPTAAHGPCSVIGSCAVGSTLVIGVGMGVVYNGVEVGWSVEKISIIVA